MDFLPRYFVNCALACALCLISLPVFAAYSGLPVLNWSQGPDGLWNISQLAPSNFGPQGSSFVENSAGDGVIQSIAAPDLIVGSSGNISLAGNLISVSRGLTVGDLIDGAKALMVPDNPYGAAFLALTLVGSLALDAYDNANPVNPSNSPPISSSNPYFPGGCTTPKNIGAMSPQAEINGYWGPNSGVTIASSQPFAQGIEYFTSSSGQIYCYGSPSDTAPSGYGGNSETPSQAIQWAQANPSSFATNVAPTLNASPSDQTSLANDLANNDAPLSTPVPYGYNIPSPDATVTGSPTTTTSTDPSTGQTTTTTATPTYDFSSPNGNGVQVDRTIKTVTQSCTSAGSCSVTNTTTNTTPATQPKLGSFTSPAVSAPATSAITPTPFALDLKMPSQSSAVCPSPLSYTAFGTSFTISLSPLCTLATDVRPYVEALGAVGAGLVIFR